MKIFPPPLAALTAFVFSSCSITASLYPVSGPMTKAVDVRSVALVVHGVEGNSGTADLVLPSGEKCTGRWSVLAPRMAGTIDYSGNGSISSGLEAAFVRINGRSYVNVNVPGVNHGQAFLTGDRGTTIEAAFLVGSGTASGYGAAKDSAGNTYKLLF